MAVNPWAPQPAAMTWGDGYDWLRRTRETPQPAAPGTAPYALPDTVNDPWKTPGGGWNTAPGNWHWAQQSQGTADPLSALRVQSSDWTKSPTQPQMDITRQSQGTAAQAAATQAGAAAGSAATTFGSGPSGKTGTAGRTGATYAKFLAANPQFDPWTNGDSYWGAGGGNDPIIAQAFGWTNAWARDHGYADGSQIPLAQKQQMFLANLERARQQWADNANDPTARQGVTWETSAASKIPNEGWYYEAGSGLTGKPVTQAPTTTTPPATTNGQGTGGNTEEPVADLEAGNGGGGGTGLPAVNNAYLAGSSGKEQRLALLLQALGVKTGAGRMSGLGQTAARVAGVFDPWMETQGIDGKTVPQDDIMGMINKFLAYMKGGGAGFGGLRADANNAYNYVMNNAGTFRENYDPSELQGLLGGFQQMGTLNYNPVQSRLRGNQWDNQLADLALQQGNEIAGGKNPDQLTHLLDLLANNPTFKFATGR